MPWLQLNFKVFHALPQGLLVYPVLPLCSQGCALLQTRGYASCPASIFLSDLHVGCSVAIANLIPLANLSHTLLSACIASHRVLDEVTGWAAHPVTSSKK